MRSSGSVGAVLLVALAAIGAPACSGDETKASTGNPPNVGTVDDIMDDLPQSCSFSCDTQCAEPKEPFACPTIKSWGELPHAKECPTWDGKQPAPTAGKCTASEPSGDAARKAGPIAGGFVLPDGHPILPAGREVVFAEPDLVGGFPMSLLAIPGARFALASDGGIKDNALRVLDLDALAGAGEAVASYLGFSAPKSLFYGLAWLPPNRALASGGGDGVVYAFDIDTTTGAVTAVPDRDVQLGKSGDNVWYAGAIAATGDGQRLVVGPSEYAQELQILSLADADYGKKLAVVDIEGSHAVFDVRLDPFDPAGKTFYASDQSASRLIELDAAAGKVTRTIDLQKNPAQLVFLDATWMVVAEADSDALAIVDRVAGSVATRVQVFEPDSPRGFSPSALAYYATAKRLFATLAGVNAIEVYDVALGTPPTITPKGKIPTAWWPTAVMVDDKDGSIVILNGKGHGTGTDKKQYPWGEGPITERMHGSVQRVPASDLADLTASTAVVEKTRKLADGAGRSQLTCPDGAKDFPVAADNESGPSDKIKHVILVVRENKTYDALFGDRKDLGDGDPSLVMASTPELQQAIWQNARAVAAAFTNFDNFYTDAEQSIQGHIWTVYGRTSDYVERSWLSTWGRETRPLTAPNTSVESQTEEGGLFQWLTAAGIDNDDMGEAVNPGPNGLVGDYPGFIYAQNVPDIDKSCYLGGRIRLRCDLKPFTYALQTNDHTYGGAAGSAAPEVMIAVNDEAIGLLLDALSHSPIWQDSLLIVTEDDPQDGGDHIDLHRSILIMASPWVKRGYVSHGHYDMASVHKLVAHVFGIPYNNELAREALLPLDAFTSTPDFTPFTYQPRTVDAPCNPSETKEAHVAERWDFDDLDDQPGLSEQIMSMMKRPPEERGVVVARAAPPK